MAFTRGRHLIAIDDLVFEYPGQRALDGVSLHLPAGSVTALVGPNGAGKSTLLRCMAGLDQALSGRIVVHGVDVAESPRQVHRHIGYLSDFYGLYERLSARQCLHYAALAMGVAPAQAPQRVQAVAAQLDIAPLLERLPSQLSRGQRQRLAIGQAIIHQPAVLLLDEPASGLDPEARASLSQLMRQLQAQGMTLVVSSHILSELDEYCTHILALRAGRIESHAPLQPTHAQQAQLQLFALELAQPPTPEQLYTWFTEHAQVQLHDSAQALQAPGQPLLLWLPSAASARAALLAQWVQAGIPIASLAPQRESLQQRYRRQVPADTSAQP